MKILAIALSGIGDALMFTPTITELRKKYPDAEIDTLVMFNAVRQMFEKNPDINEIYYFDFLNSSPIKILSYVLSLRNKFDISFSVYPSNRWEYNLIAYLINAPIRAAVDYLRYKGRNAAFLNNYLVEENDNLHNVEENIKLFEKVTGETVNNIGRLKFYLSQTDLDFADNFLREKNVSKEELIIGMHAGCSTLKNHIKRRWEPEKFARLSEILSDKLKAKILLFGGSDEKELKQEIMSESSVSIINVQTDNLVQSASVMSKCGVFISNDSGLMHIAAALGLNVVSIIGPTNTNYIHPWKTEYRIASINLDCAPCFYYSPKPLTCSRTDVKFKCIKELDIELVYKKVTELL
ncbi:MAG: glycosyltransferase family 9 protein [Melioribacteraceae bacterium]|nr:glycosyltransferase family 9 protein [Melioribacteraceae bacterium]MDD3557188.1 glycosyltransferase family 9 protein [Melioribacteraceae bacterium]